MKTHNESHAGDVEVSLLQYNKQLEQPALKSKLCRSHSHIDSFLLLQGTDAQVLWLLHRVLKHRVIVENIEAIGFCLES